jgi:hypothetical protein
VCSDRDELIELMSRYSVVEDTKNYEMAEEILTPDIAVRDDAFTEPSVGIAAWKESLRQAVEPLDATHHMFANFIITIDGDVAHMQAKSQAVHVKHGLPDGELLVIGLTYDLKARKSDGKWKLSEVVIEPNWTSGNPAVLGHLGLGAVGN